MKNLLLLPLIAISLMATAQTTSIPDVNFEQALINLGYDNVIDGGVLTANISGVTSLVVQSQNISDLTGIEDFTALEHLDCWSNQLTSLDVTQNTALTVLECSYNQLTSLDVSQNTALTIFACGANQLTTLDVSQNTALERLDCRNNQLTSVDLTQNTALEYLWCQSNQLTNLDVSQNTALGRLNCYNNQLTSLDLTQNIALLHLDCSYNQLSCLNVKNGNNSSISLFSSNNNFSLSCIEVDDVAWSTANWTDIDAGVTFSTNCSNACSGIPTTTEEYSNQPRKLIRILDLLGRETNFKPNTPLIYQYDDGSVEKVIREY